MLWQTFFVVWYQLPNTLVIGASCLRFQPILYAGLQLIVSKCCPPTTVSYKEKDENHRESSPGGWWWAIKHFPPKMLQEPLCCSCSVWPRIYHEEGQHSSSLVLNKGRTPHLARDSIVLGMFTGSLHAQNWQMWCVVIGGHTRDIAQHICAKLHLILTVVLISQQTRPSKKDSPLIIICLLKACIRIFEVIGRINISGHWRL